MSRLSLLAVLLGIALSAGCGGGEAGGPVAGEPISAEQSSTNPCDRPGNSTLRPAVCSATGTPSLDPAFSRDFVAPATDRSSCTTSAALVFYAADDWMRLAQKLAAGGYACADYFISIPPTTGGDGTYTVPNADQVTRLRALGTGFHAMAEIRVTAWEEWVEENTGKTWFDAGVEARRRMASAGYDAAKGDTWAVNEFPLEVATDRQIQANMRDLVRGLATGSGGQPVQGVVFAVTPEQVTPDLESYKSQLERFLENDSFWHEMSASVRFWAEEVYADSKSCCVAGTTTAERADRLDEYLFHRLTLVNAGPSSTSVARAFLERAFTPIANAAWAWTTAFGYTGIPAGEMKRFVAEQVYAIRSFQEAPGHGSGMGGIRIRVGTPRAGGSRCEGLRAGER